MAFEPGVVSQNCVFITETPYMCLTVFALYFLLRCVLCWRMRYFYAGLACFCAAALLKGLAVLIPLAVLLYALRRRVPLVKWLPRIVLALVTCALILLPFSVQNKLSGGSLAPFSTSQGDQKLLGTYWGLGYPEGSYDQALAALYSGEQERDEKIASRGEYADERYAQWISENPAGFLFTQLMYKPAALITQNYYIKILGIPIRLVNVLWWGVLALAACGVVGSRRRRAERPPGFYVPLLYLALAVPITAIWIPIARYNAPHVPLIAFYAAVGMLDLWAWVRRAGKRKAAASTL
jgi:4-amino-4-deoxy-L-arabinose transferase-like glycosyltransferase